MRFSLVCLPFAGSGASFYWPWRKLESNRFKVIPLQLPGREELLEQEPFADVAVAARQLVPELIRQAGGDPVALYGHSLGAVLAFELARELERLGKIRVVHLFPSGSPGPWTGRSQRATGLDDEQFLAKVTEFAGYHHEAFDNPEMRDLLLPLLKADVAMHENYVPPDARTLHIPVTTMRGVDDALVSADDAAQWAGTTSGPFSTIEVPGGHMYLVDAPGRTLAAIERRVAEAIGEN
jgi:surfactin synthase thioesterase subunit